MCNYYFTKFKDEKTEARRSNLCKITKLVSNYP